MSNSSIGRVESWGTAVTDALGVFAAVWGVALGVLLVGLPIALALPLPSAWRGWSSPGCSEGT